jgi:hypothetical protein
MASVARARVVAKEGEGNRKVLEAKNKAAMAEVAKAALSLTRMKKALSSVLHKGNMEGTNS